jgi:hypothetical protein
MKIVVLLVLWFFILNGAIIVSKICLWAMKHDDVIYKMTGSFILTFLWLFIINEARQTINKIKNKL